MLISTRTGWSSVNSWRRDRFRQATREVRPLSRSSQEGQAAIQFLPLPLRWFLLLPTILIELPLLRKVCRRWQRRWTCSGEPLACSSRGRGDHGGDPCQPQGPLDAAAQAATEHGGGVAKPPPDNSPPQRHHHCWHGPLLFQPQGTARPRSLSLPAISFGIMSCQLMMNSVLFLLLIGIGRRWMPIDIGGWDCNSSPPNGCEDSAGCCLWLYCVMMASHNLV